MKTKDIRKICIANRGEIAIRIAEAARQDSRKSLTLFSEDDLGSAHIAYGDESASLGGGSLAETYLNAEKIIAAALNHGCDALHPGYGFLAENADFAEACEKAGLLFIGPPARVIRLMGNKLAARDFAVQCGAPVTPGLQGSPEELTAKAGRIGWPVLVKAAAGGGGKGMRLAGNEKEFIRALETTHREALSYFGDGSVYVEKFLESPRHIEVQILGDRHGRLVHLHERECSMQRRYQKIIEEAPAPGLSDEQRQAIHSSALKIARAADYYSAGTMEFLLDAGGDHYFLEMNTRIQVEHPVTEIVTGVDIVREQIRIAEGKPLSFGQEDISVRGHAIECRIYAENPSESFMPSPGNISYYSPPEGPGLRLDSSVFGATEVKSQFDPMIAKLIAGGPDRQSALDRMRQALSDYVIMGIHSNIPFLSALIDLPDFRELHYSTVYIDQKLPELLAELEIRRHKACVETAFAAALNRSLQKSGTGTVWDELGHWRQHSVLKVLWEDRERTVEICPKAGAAAVYRVDGKELRIRQLAEGEHCGGRSAACLEVNGESVRCHVFEAEPGLFLTASQGHIFEFRRPDRLDERKSWRSGEADSSQSLRAQTPGKVIRVLAEAGQTVEKGEELLIIESMKMENSLRAAGPALIAAVHVGEGDTVSAGELLVEFSAEAALEDE